MNICIGIISYLPEDGESRSIREEKLKTLVSKCDELFNLPIMIIAQNWKDFSLESNNVNTIKYDNALGIVEARKTLRSKFLESNYDYLIMLDDDCKISGSKEAANLYIDQIKAHPDGCGMFNFTLLKLFAISKDLFSKVNFGDGRVEDGDFFEDILFVNTLQKKYPSKLFNFKKNGLFESSNNVNDPHSTWFHGQFVKSKMGDKTRELIKRV